MLHLQQEIILSPYSALYDLVIPADHILRKMNELIDYSFVYQELQSKYTPETGRPAEDPIRMFKYLLLKEIDDLSDVDVVKHTLCDLSYKYFLGLAPEETKLIDPSSLTKFRRLRLKDMDLLNLLINKTVEIAIQKGIIKNKRSIIMDATHTQSRSNPHNPIEVLRMRSKNLRKTLYGFSEDIKDKLPAKNTDDDIQHEIAYSQQLVDFLQTQDILVNIPAISEKLNLLQESIGDILTRFTTSKDKDARVGHKTADTSFFGYKTHIAMDDESRIITSAIITTGDAGDGTQMQQLLDKSMALGIEVENVIGDTAYSGKKNIETSEQKGVTVYAKLHPLSFGSRKDEDRFEFNKDAGRYVCPAGHLAIKKKLQHRKGHSDRIRYHFDPIKCQVCPLKDTCLSPTAKHRVYNVTIGEFPETRKAFQESEQFKQMYKHRYKIEAKNAELKCNFGYDRAISYGVENMTMQGALSIFACNMKRIINLLGK